MKVPRTVILLLCLSATLTVCLADGQARADQIVLKDGRQWTGVVVQEAPTVVIRTRTGTLIFPADEVAEVRRMVAPAEELEERLAGIASDDSAGLFEASQWAAERGLPDQAEALLRRVIALESNHVGARRALRDVRLAGTWRPFDDALQTLQAVVSVGAPTDVEFRAIEQLCQMAESPAELLAVGELRAHSLLCRGEYRRAAEALTSLVPMLPVDRSSRPRAVLRILRENPDGMVVLTSPWPATAMLLDRPVRVVGPGPASLSDPLVVEAVLRTEARSSLSAGAASLAEARSSAAVDPLQAEHCLEQAEARFDEADAIVPRIARSYRIELTRHRVAMFRRQADRHAARFDAEFEALGRQDLSRSDYESRIRRIAGHLGGVRESMDSILDLCEPYRVELRNELEWARMDRDRVAAMQETLDHELDIAEQATIP